MASIRGFVLVLLVSAVSGYRAPTHSDLAPLLTRTVVIPNTRNRETPTATPWPEEFTISFTTDNASATGELIYDWGNKQQAIIHGHGASHCRSRGGSGPCYILENPLGTFEVDPVNRKCENTFPDVGSVPPSWTVQGVFAGVEDVNGVLCNRFQYPPTMHAWLETVDGGLPCGFVFPDPALTYWFDLETLKLGQPELNVFRVPEYCEVALTAAQ